MNAGVTMESDYGAKSSGQAVWTERLTLRKPEVGTPVFVVERCIAAAMAAGTVYESIKSIKSRSHQQNSHCQGLNTQ